MSKEPQMRALAEHVLQSTLATLPRRPLPISAHQAAAELYDAVDRYTDAINNNQHAAAKAAAEKLAVETFRVLASYELPRVPAGIDRVHVENKSASTAPKSTV